MRAVWYDRQGPAKEVLVLGERPKPEPGPREVLIAVHASSVNPSDARARAGGMGPMAYPRITPNSDGAGVIEAAGALVPRSVVGKRVWFNNGQRNGRAFGSAADYIELDFDLVRELPADVSFLEGATLGIPAMTAHVCLFARGPVQGLTVLVTGGAGAVSHYAVQLAKWAGATVIATVSGPAKAEHALAGGADHVINYRTEDLTRRLIELAGPDGVDHVVDVDFYANFEKILPVMRPGGSYAYYATNLERHPAPNMLEVMRRNLTIHAVVLPTYAFDARKRAFDDITRWISTGRRMLTVASVHPLEETWAAHEAVERGDKLGTVIVKVR
jgi:NADPH2:quinone reductase